MKKMVSLIALVAATTCGTISLAGNPAYNPANAEMSHAAAKAAIEAAVEQFNNTSVSLPQTSLSKNIVNFQMTFTAEQWLDMAPAPTEAVINEITEFSFNPETGVRSETTTEMKHLLPSNWESELELLQVVMSAAMIGSDVPLDEWESDEQVQENAYSNGLAKLYNQLVVDYAVVKSMPIESLSDIHEADIRNAAVTRFKYNQAQLQAMWLPMVAAVDSVTVVDSWNPVN